MRQTVAAFLLALIIVPTCALAGLDVTALANLKKVEHPKLNAGGEPIDQKSEIRLTPSKYFTERFLDLEAGAVYKFENWFHFRAGPYSSFNLWRNELAKIAGYPSIKVKTFRGTLEERHDAFVRQTTSGPFWELINFYDDEGVIGPIACKKLYKDFIKFHGSAMKHPDENFREMYLQWEKAFKLASENGALLFH